MSITQTEFVNRPWRTRVYKKNNYVIWNEDLKIKGQGADLNAAYADLNRATENYWAEMKDFGLLDQLPGTKKFSFKSFFCGEAHFFARHLILGVFYIVVFLVMSGILVKQIDRTTTRIIAEYSKATASTSTPEGARRHEKFTEDMQNLKPYIREIKKVWEESK